MLTLPFSAANKKISELLKLTTCDSDNTALQTAISVPGYTCTHLKGQFLASKMIFE